MKFWLNKPQFIITEQWYFVLYARHQVYPSMDIIISFKKKEEILLSQWFLITFHSSIKKKDWSIFERITVDRMQLEIAFSMQSIFYSIMLSSILLVLSIGLVNIA